MAETFANFGVAFLPYWLPGRLLWAMPVVALAVWGAVTLLRRIETRRVGLALLALLLTPILGQLAASLIRPIYGDRTMIWAGLPFLMLAAQGWVSLRQKWMRFAVAGIVLALTTLALFNYYVDSPKEAMARGGGLGGRPDPAGGRGDLQCGMDPDPL